jgi:metallo-beta-lactamase family protein
MSTLLRFCGATRTVTGSCHMLETAGARILIDCGMFQGPKTLKALNYDPFPFRPTDIDAVLLTHAHIDHSGLLPKLVRQGFTGPIFATPGTIDLCSYLLPDAGNIQESEVEILNTRNARRGRPAVEPIYTAEDATGMMTSFSAVAYETWIDVAPGIRARYWNAGHLLGSASIEIECRDNNQADPLRILASGDIGPDAKLLQPDPEAPADFDYVIAESTYGDRDRPAVTEEERRRRLAKEVREAIAGGGTLLIPAFAVERTQELLVDLFGLMERGEISAVPVFLDSPLAIRATSVFRKHSKSLSPEINLDRVMQSPNLRCTETVDQSKALSRVSGSHIVIAGSGMCDAGRIRHHLRQWLWHKNATVLLVGFQAKGTLGRFLADGAKAVRIFGEEIKVAARIRMLDEYSGHADGPELTRWVAERRPIRRGLFLVHGEEPALQGLSARIAERLLPEARMFIPILDDVYDLSSAKPTPMNGGHRRRLAPDAVVSLDWHNDMSELILDINDRIDAAADDRARRVIIRRLRRALNEE